MILFGTGKMITTLDYDASGVKLATPTPVHWGSLQDISIDIDVDMKTLYGSQRFPISVGQGKGKIEIKAKYGEISGAILGGMQFGKAGTSGVRAGVFDFAVTIPKAEGANPPAQQFIVEPPLSGTFVADMGVLDSATGESLQRVAPAEGKSPAPGEYTVVNGTYKVAPAAQERTLLVSYEYRANSSKGQVFRLTNDVMGTTPSFTLMLQNSFDGQNLVMRLNRVVSSKLSLPFKNDDYSVYDLNAQAFADAAGEIGYLCLFPS